MKELDSTTKAGQRVLAMGERCLARSLNELYKDWSYAKQRAFDWCWEEYANDPCAEGFRVGNANCFGFTASWYTVYYNHDAMRVETKDNSYIVVFPEDRDEEYFGTP